MDVSKKSGIGLVTFDKSNPVGFGRIVRDENKQKKQLKAALLY
jgi:bifunctional UDP-N-acetylglucosamine pyrophosphorylase/glucosamine-1-phosphate N-acetyltransferase